MPVGGEPGRSCSGSILGVLRTRGRDKVTLVASPGIQDLGAWLEQLLAESTGKQGKGLIPVDREPLGPPEVYGGDRLFVYLRLESAPDAAQDARGGGPGGAGQPVVRIAVPEPYDMAEEFFRWEFATAVAGAILGINPFDQPDVEASKVATRTLTDEYERTGTPAGGDAVPRGRRGRRSSPTPRNAAALARRRPAALAGVLRAHFGRLAPGDYFALLAYVEMTAAHEAALPGRRGTACATPAGRDLRRLRPALPALDRPGATRAGRTRASSCRSPATTRPTSPVPGPAVHASA